MLVRADGHRAGLGRLPRLDRGRGPLPPRRVRIAPPHPLPRLPLLPALHVGIDGALPQAVDDREGGLAVAAALRARAIPCVWIGSRDGVESRRAPAIAAFA